MFNKGDVVVSAELGEGVVLSTSAGSVYPIRVVFENEDDTLTDELYTAEGWCNKSRHNPEQDITKVD
jgi:hypothetical protein